jgi:Lon protease-like protein
MSSPRDEQTLPVFPLTGTLLLPGTYLPLNVFEERYRNMIEDALEGDLKIGMVQPWVPGLDNWGIPPLDLRDPELYPVGCCGRIGQHELQSDGRYLIVLEGLIRFRILDELEPVRGYRRVRADFTEFAVDRSAEEPDLDKQGILAVLESYAQQRDLEFDFDLLAALAGRRLINTLSTALPFSSVEKQVLLEARSEAERATLLISLMEMHVDSVKRPEASSPPTIN